MPPGQEAIPGQALFPEGEAREQLVIRVHLHRRRWRVIRTIPKILVMPALIVAFARVAVKQVLGQPYVMTLTLADDDRKELTSIDFSVSPAGGEEEALERIKQIAIRYPQAAVIGVYIAGVFVCWGELKREDDR